MFEKKPQFRQSEKSKRLPGGGEWRRGAEKPQLSESGREVQQTATQQVGGTSRENGKHRNAKESILGLKEEMNDSLWHP